MPKRPSRGRAKSPMPRASLPSVLAGPSHADPQALAAREGLRHRRPGHRRPARAFASCCTGTAQGFSEAHRRAIGQPLRARVAHHRRARARRSRQRRRPRARGRPSEVGIESTIVDLSGRAPVLLRPGHISKEEIEALIGAVAKKRNFAPPFRRPRAPLRAAHAGAARSLLCSGQGDRPGKGQVAVLAFSRPDERVDYWLRMPRDPQAYAQRLMRRYASSTRRAANESSSRRRPRRPSGARCATA